jgi:hypothetical protein
MGRQAKLRKLKKACEFVASKSDNPDVMALDAERMKLLVRKIYKDAKKGLVNASRGIPLNKPKQGQSE